MIEQFKSRIPEVLALGNLGLKNRHWEEISNVIGFKINPNQRPTLEKVLNLNLQKYVPQLEIISEGASKESNLEKKLSIMIEEWNDLNFTLLDYKYINMTIKWSTSQDKLKM